MKSVQPVVKKGLGAPLSPNPIGFSVIELMAVEGSTLHVRGVDMLDATLLLDVKPFVPAFDRRDGAQVGWLAGRVNELERSRRKKTAEGRFPQRSF